MSGVYALMDTLLPFEWLHYTFMKNALIAIVLLTPLFGMLGTMAVGAWTNSTALSVSLFKASSAFT